MRWQSRTLVPWAAITTLLSGCMAGARVDLARQTGGNAALYAQFRAYDGRSGQALAWPDIVARCRQADAIFFGEEHSDPVCNALEAQLLHALCSQPRPTCVAMEFFEADTQAALDAYLRDRLEEPAFRTQTRQNRAYLLAHRPLIELCRAAGLPVLAANAPRRLVREFRKSGLSYDEFRAGLEPTDLRWLPLANEYVAGPYKDRFFDMMSGHEQPTTAPASQPATLPTSQPASAPAGESTASFYASQLLWDQAMAESLVDFRERFPSHRTLLIVGVFHVAHDGGTVVKFRARRPTDRVATIVYRSAADTRLAFDADDRAAGDVVIYGVKPPPEERRAETAPPTMPTPTQPASAPASQPVSPPAAAPDATRPAFVPREIPIREVLVVGQVGHGTHLPVHTDAVEELLVTGRWTPPTSGQRLVLPDGTSRTWQHVVAGDDGVLRHEALNDGYAFASLESEREQIMFLDAAAHSLVYVNRELRVGDVYGHGYVRVPVLLRPGTNEFLFFGGRRDARELQARLVEPRAPFTLDTRDLTTPDLIVGEAVDAWAAVVVLNASTTPLRGAQLTARLGAVTQATPVPDVPALSLRKVGFRLVGAAPTQGGTATAEVVLSRGAEELDRAAVPLRLRQRHETYKRTFISDIDGSVQYYAVTEGRLDPSGPDRPALFLSLHGAAVEAVGQAACYANKTWGHVVSPTNRRPFGFAWEEWGRLDALEVLALAEQTFNPDPQRIYLTGHSMGGHGTWQIGVTYPDRFAAIAPSAGWITFWSYRGAERFSNATPVELLLQRATNPADTVRLSPNCAHHGVYVLHGDLDDNVPVTEARSMRRVLGEFHPNFAYYERPGVGHWWGNECVDWPPLFDFLQQNTRPPAHTVSRVKFLTANPAVSARCDWVTIEAQQRSLDWSRLDLALDPQARRIAGTTANVQRLTIALRVPTNDSGAFIMEPGQPVQIELDGQSLADIPWPAQDRLHLQQVEGAWTLLTPLATTASFWAKGPHRAGPFKDAFRHRMQFVYGTRGTSEENDWALHKARYDAEVFWYRGNGSVDLIADTAFDPAAEPERGVVLYGNADTNAAWTALLARSPIQTSRGRVQIGERVCEGDNLAVLTIHPRPDSRHALVAVVSGTGLPGMRLTDRLSYFVGGVSYPDWLVVSTDALRHGTPGVRAIGYFDSEWRVDPDQSAWQDPPR